LAPLLHGWIGWVLFAVAVYIVSLYLTSGFAYVLTRIGFFANIDATIYVLLTRILFYCIVICLMIVIPRWLKKPLSLRTMGIDRVMSWKDIAVGVAGLIGYFLLAMGSLALLKLIPGVDVSQVQDLDVGHVYGASLMLVFVVLVLITPFAEELLFRGVLYGGLRTRKLPMWASALIVSALFGIAHGQLNVGVDVFCLSLVACYARELTGSVWAGVVLHMIKNFIAFAIVYGVARG
jgi:membrane protease YdiL (CAAX protease family)